MSFNNNFTAVTGATYTAAQYNTHTRDNLTAIWVYTTAGDIAYATGATTLARLGLGAEYKFLQVNAAANAPQWGGLQFASVYHNTTQNLTNGTPTALAFNSEISDLPGWHDPAINNSYITPTIPSAVGFYIASIFYEYTGAGGSGHYYDVIELMVNGVSVMRDRKYYEVDAFTKAATITFPIYQINSPLRAEIFVTQNSGGTRTVQSGCIFSLLRVG